MGRNEEALPCFDEALRLDPKNPQAYYNKGNSLVQLQRYEEALVCFTRPTAWPRGSRVVWYNRAICELVLEQPQQAGASLRRYLSLDPPRDALTDQARWLLHGIDTGELKRLARGQGPPKPGELRAGRGDAGEGAGSPGERGPDVQPPRAPAPPLLPRRRPPPPRPPHPRRRSRAGSAPAAWVRPALGPTVADLNDEGDGHFQAGRFAEALASFERALELDPFGAVALGNRANALFKLGKDRRSDRGPRARPGLRSLLPPELGQQGGHRADERTPGRGPRLLPRGRGPGAAGPGSHAQADAQAQGPTSSSRPESKHRREVLWAGWERARSSARPGDSRRPSKRSIERSRQAPDLTEAWLMKAEALRQLKRTERRHGPRSRKPCDDGPRIPCSGTPGRIDLKNAGAPRRGRGRFDRALALEPRHAASWSDRGRALGALKRLDESIESLERAIALRPEAAPPWLNKALAEEEAHRPADAVHSFRMFLERATPEHASGGDGQGPPRHSGTPDQRGSADPLTRAEDSRHLNANPPAKVGAAAAGPETGRHLAPGQLGTSD